MKYGGIMPKILELQTPKRRLYFTDIRRFFKNAKHEREHWKLLVNCNQPMVTALIGENNVVTEFEHQQFLDSSAWESNGAWDEKWTIHIRAGEFLPLSRPHLPR